MGKIGRKLPRVSRKSTYRAKSSRFACEDVLNKMHGRFRSANPFGFTSASGVARKLFKRTIMHSKQEPFCLANKNVRTKTACALHVMVMKLISSL